MGFFHSILISVRFLIFLFTKFLSALHYSLFYILICTVFQLFSPMRQFFRSCSELLFLSLLGLSGISSTKFRIKKKKKSLKNYQTANLTLTLINMQVFSYSPILSVLLDFQIKALLGFQTQCI